MRKRVSSYQASTRRLLTLLLISFLFLDSADSIAFSSKKTSTRRGRCAQEKTPSDAAGFTATGAREHRTSAITVVHSLVSKCSEAPIALWREHKLDARGNMESAKQRDGTQKEHFEFSSNEPGLIFIRSRRTRFENMFLCFNRRGRLRAKRIYTKRIHGKKKKLCGFREISYKDEDGFYYQSRWNSNWYIGANRKGKIMPGDRWMKPRRSRRYRNNRRGSALRNGHHRRHMKSPRRLPYGRDNNWNLNKQTPIPCRPNVCYRFYKWPRQYEDSSMHRMSKTNSKG